MMWALIGILVAVEAAKLDNTYLPPPPSAKESGGSDGALEVPLEPPYIDQYTPNEQPQAWRPGTRSLKKDPKGSATPAENKFLENEDEITVPALEKGRFISGSYSYTGPDNVLVTVTYKADSRKGREEEDVKDDEENVAEEDSVNGEQAEEDDVANEEEEDDSLVVPTPPSLPAELARAFDFHKSKHLGQEEKTIRTKKPIRKNHKNKVDKHGNHGGHHYGSGSQGNNGYGSGNQGNNGYGSGNQGSNSYGSGSQGNNGYGSGSHSQNNYEGQYGQKVPGHIHGHKQGISGPAYQYPPPNQYGTPTIHQGYSYPKAS